MTDYILQLIRAIRKTHGVKGAKHVETVPVTETFQGETIWQGEVEVFDIRHPRAKRAYAWAHSTGEDTQGKRFVAVLGIPPVTSAETAVKAAIMAEIKEDERKKAKGGPS